jgi:hypothetical protein
MLPTDRTNFSLNFNILSNQSSKFGAPPAHSDPKCDERREHADIKGGLRQWRIRERSSQSEATDSKSDGHQDHQRKEQVPDKGVYRTPPRSISLGARIGFTQAGLMSRLKIPSSRFRSGACFPPPTETLQVIPATSGT